MRTESAFWDTSAIIPICCLQNASLSARSTNRKFETSVIWWGTAVEIYSGLARLRRLREIDDSGIKSAIRKWEAFEREANVIRPVDHVIDIAIKLPKLYGLRSQDAFQLAAALEWCSERPRNRPFITADHRLGQAATDAGFTALSVG